jgi:shikimate kinase
MSNGPAPLLSVVELKTFLDQLHVERDRLFEEVATLVVDSKSVDDDVQLILKKLEG